MTTGIKNISEKFIKDYGLKRGEIKWGDIPKSKKLSEIRKKIVFGLLKNISEKVECQEKCKYISVGSENITSDLDITITGKKSDEIVSNFEKDFQSLFKDTPQAVFDTNLYASTFIFEPETPNYKIIKSKNKTLYLIDTKGKDYNSQLSFALVKLIENSNSEQMKIINKNIPEKLVSESIKLLSCLKNDTGTYIDHIKKMKILKDKFENSEGKNKIKNGVRFKKQISIANFNSEETYYTQGAFLHIVGKMQSGFKNLPVSKKEYINSIIENTGFLLENYNKFDIIKDKYVDRIVDGFKNIGVKFKKTKKQDILSILCRVLSKIQF